MCYRGESEDPRGSKVHDYSYSTALPITHTHTHTHRSAYMYMYIASTPTLSFMLLLVLHTGRHPMPGQPGSLFHTQEREPVVRVKAIYVECTSLKVVHGRLTIGVV